MTFELFLRLLGMIVLAVAGWTVGTSLAGNNLDDPEVMQGAIPLALAGSVLGLLLTPYFTRRAFAWVRRHVYHLPANQLFSGTLGLILGLLIAALLALPLSHLPGLLGQLLPFMAALLFGYLGVQMMVVRERDLVGFLSMLFTAQGSRHYVLLDTSAIIDGRVADIAQTGFIAGTLLVPRFVLTELQQIADSKDAARRNRGKRGLEVLNQLQKESGVSLEIGDVDVPHVQEVDSKLVVLARDLRASVLTTDYNLNKVAELQGIKVLNINELANALKTRLLPGEQIEVDIVQPGKERGQGIGYLDDGTMVVIEHGHDAIGQKRSVEVMRVFQTAAGRMIFAQIARPSPQP